MGKYPSSTANRPSSSTPSASRPHSKTENVRIDATRSPRRHAPLRREFAFYDEIPKRPSQPSPKVKRAPSVPRDFAYYCAKTPEIDSPALPHIKQETPERVLETSPAGMNYWPETMPPQHTSQYWPLTGQSPFSWPGSSLTTSSNTPTLPPLEPRVPYATLNLDSVGANNALPSIREPNTTEERQPKWRSFTLRVRKLNQRPGMSEFIPGHRCPEDLVQKWAGFETFFTESSGQFVRHGRFVDANGYWLYKFKDNYEKYFAAGLREVTWIQKEECSEWTCPGPVPHWEEHQRMVRARRPEGF